MGENRNPKLEKLLSILTCLAIYYLSSKMICFAIPKFLFMQFRILHYESFVPLAELTKYQHMWSFFGRSYNYNLFIGFMEFLSGALILFKRTRLIALLILVGILTNILILNIEFEIDFAISHVTVDLILVLLLLSTYRRDLYKFFISLGGKFNDAGKTKKTRLGQVIPYIFLITLSISYFVFSLSMKSKYIVDEEIVGSHNIKSLRINGNLIKLNKGSLGNRPLAFIEHNNQFVLSIEDTLVMGRYMLDENKIQIYLDTPIKNETTSVKGTLSKNGIIGITGKEETFELLFERVDGNNDYLNQLYE